LIVNEDGPFELLLKLRHMLGVRAWRAIRRAFRSLWNERDRKSTHVRMVRESLGCGFLGCTLPDLPEDWDDNRTSVCTVGDCNHD